ncbi:protein FAM151B isoform X2 [Agrilus planipennis]|uniref:Protein FAM151B isoform X2 n=1 Tax=Agrilus planipennis TaxID=224129 RepID=A0A1W4WU70_AGRPL|nr:protein FAM151B isoform X2 [Agrilus planipennis]
MLLQFLFTSVFSMASSHSFLVRSSEVTDFNISAAITWAHAVNNRSYLESCLASEDLKMIEADIVLGTLTTSQNSTVIPIMGHPPANTSDLSLEHFLSMVKEHNSNSFYAKGVKLDFKTIEVFEASLSILQSKWSEIDFPVWINADIVPGPVNATTIPVDPTRFFEGCALFDDAVLSIGWTTNFGGSIKKGTYTKGHIQSMLNVIEENKPTQKITFPVRAGIAAESLGNMQLLLQSVANSSLTIWSSEGDPVNVEHLKTLIMTIGLGSVYIDVPKDLFDQLGLYFGSSKTSPRLPPLPYILGLMIICFINLAVI